MNKDIILAISCEWMGGGCGVLRMQHNATYINQKHAELGVMVLLTPMPLFDPELLIRTRCVLVQRPFVTMPWLKRYRELQEKFGYSIVGEVDDNFTTYRGENVPDYNLGSLKPRDWDAVDRCSEENLKYIDRMITATDFLARILHDKFNYWNTVTVPNVCERALWSRERKDFFREKPLVLSASAMQHVRPPQPISQQFPVGVTGLRGDYVGEWPEFLRKHVDDMDLHYFADIPYFLDCVREHIQFHQWQPTDMYIGEYNRIRPDIVIAPLKNNVFNRCKSKLKFTECCASGAILVGSDFEDGPYSCIHPMCKVPDNPTVVQLEKIFEDVREHWKEILEYQYSFINDNGEFVESADHINKWLGACMPPNQKLI